MGTVDRRPYLTATVMTQALLDQMASNLDFGLELAAEVQTPQIGGNYSNPSGTLVEVFSPGHPFRIGMTVVITGATAPTLIGTWPVTAATPTTYTFDRGAAFSPDTGSAYYTRPIYTSDRNKYVGGTFYEAGCTFPTIKRTIGDWLSPAVEFSRLELPVTNVDGRYNHLLPGGADFAGWIGKAVEVKLGIRDAAATYQTIYRGRVTDVGGLQRDRSKLTVIARDDLDRLNQNFPKTGMTAAAFPDIEDNLQNTILPAIYGDWTVEPLQIVPDATGTGGIVTASVPAFPANGANASVLLGTANLLLVISDVDLQYFSTTDVWMKRGDVWTNFAAADVTGVVSNRQFQLKGSGSGGVTLVDGAPWEYKPGDLFFVRVKGKDLGAYDDNIVWQARDLLLTYGGAVVGDFDGTWLTYRDKASPSVSAIAAIKSRVWINEPENVVSYVLSMFEQVRLEAFLSRDLQLAISSLHFDEFEAAPAYTVRQWDLVDQSLAPKLDDRNVWNRARGEYAYDPATKAQSRETGTYRNAAAIAQAGKEISKKVTFPNLYVAADVEAQLQEMLKLASAYSEFIDLTLTPRALLLDIGDFVALDVDMGGVVFAGVPAMIREIGYDPSGLRIPVKVWSFQMVKFPPGWDPANAVGGSTATITLE